ncbi:MAG: hypothetical protein HRU80_08510 [Ignavibacteriales bacterium]|nr:MAG: hypothetical protein HRU80_08510 [Ignavibacteriales bacterium]
MMKNLINYTFLSIILTTASVFSQNYSLYSRFGLGSIEGSQSIRSAGLGGFGTSDLVHDYVATSNPASWSALTSTRFQFGTVLIGNSSEDASLSSYAAQGYFSGFSFAFPVSGKNGIGVSLGLLPYSSVNYDMKVRGQDSRIGSDYIQEAKGEGGLAKLYIGSSWKPAGDFRIGAALNYYFGKMSYLNTVSFTDGASLKTDFSKSYRMKGVGFDAGVISPELSGILGVEEVIPGIRVGFAMSYFNKFTSDSLFAGGNNIVIDTLSYGAGSAQIPLKLSFGASLQLNRFMRVHLDMITQSWSSYEVNGMKDPNMQDMMRIGSGFEYRVKDRDRNFDSEIYRGSIFYEKTPLVINGQSITEIGASAGVSFSLSPESYFDLSLQYIRRGTTDNGLVKENIFRLHAGMSLGEIWFLQQER